MNTVRFFFSSRSPSPRHLPLTQKIRIFRGLIFSQLRGFPYTSLRLTPPKHFGRSVGGAADSALVGDSRANPAASSVSLLGTRPSLIGRSCHPMGANLQYLVKTTRIWGTYSKSRLFHATLHGACEDQRRLCDRQARSCTFHTCTNLEKDFAECLASSDHPPPCCSSPPADALAQSSDAAPPRSCPHPQYSRAPPAQSARAALL